MSMCSAVSPSHCSFFFFNDTATTEIYTLSLHDALPIYAVLAAGELRLDGEEVDHLGERERDVREVDATAPDGQGPGDHAQRRGDRRAEDDRELGRPAPDLGRVGAGVAGRAEKGRVAEGEEPHVADQEGEGAGEERKAERLHE